MKLNSVDWLFWSFHVGILGQRFLLKRKLWFCFQDQTETHTSFIHSFIHCSSYRSRLCWSRSCPVNGWTSGYDTWTSHQLITATHETQNTHTGSSEGPINTCMLLEVWWSQSTRSELPQTRGEHVTATQNDPRPGIEPGTYSRRGALPSSWIEMNSQMLSYRSCLRCLCPNRPAPIIIQTRQPISNLHLIPVGVNVFSASVAMTTCAVWFVSVSTCVFRPSSL